MSLRPFRTGLGPRASGLGGTKSHNALALDRTVNQDGGGSLDVDIDVDPDLDAFDGDVDVESLVDLDRRVHVERATRIIHADLIVVDIKVNDGGNLNVAVERVNVGVKVKLNVKVKRARSWRAAGSTRSPRGVQQTWSWDFGPWAPVRTRAGLHGSDPKPEARGPRPTR